MEEHRHQTKKRRLHPGEDRQPEKSVQQRQDQPDLLGLQQEGSNAMESLKASLGFPLAAATRSVCNASGPCSLFFSLLDSSTFILHLKSESGNLKIVSRHGTDVVPLLF